MERGNANGRGGTEFILPRAVGRMAGMNGIINLAPVRNIRQNTNTSWYAIWATKIGMKNLEKAIAHNNKGPNARLHMKLEAWINREEVKKG